MKSLQKLKKLADALNAGRRKAGAIILLAGLILTLAIAGAVIALPELIIVFWLALPLTLIPFVIGGLLLLGGTEALSVFGYYAAVVLLSAEAAIICGLATGNIFAALYACLIFLFTFTVVLSLGERIRFNYLNATGIEIRADSPRLLFECLNFKRHRQGNIYMRTAKTEDFVREYDDCVVRTNWAYCMSLAKLPGEILIASVDDITEAEICIAHKALKKASKYYLFHYMGCKESASGTKTEFVIRYYPKDYGSTMRLVSKVVSALGKECKFKQDTVPPSAVDAYLGLTGCARAQHPVNFYDDGFNMLCDSELNGILCKLLVSFGSGVPDSRQQDIMKYLQGKGFVVADNAGKSEISAYRYEILTDCLDDNHKSFCRAVIYKDYGETAFSTHKELFFAAARIEQDKCRLIDKNSPFNAYSVPVNVMIGEKHKTDAMFGQVRDALAEKGRITPADIDAASDGILEYFDRSGLSDCGAFCLWGWISEQQMLEELDEAKNEKI